jgi:LysM repeat protein
MYGLSVDELKKMNNSISGNSIYPGQKLRVAPEKE